MSQLKLYLLGPARLERNGKVVEVETRKASALLAYLALHPERLSRDQLATLFWPEYDGERAYANLRRTLWALNKMLGDGWITADNLTLELRPQAGVWVDVLEFQRLLAQCRTHGHRGDEVCATCLAPLGEAVTLVRGDFLEGFSLRDSAAFDDWHFFEAESLRKQVAVSLEKLVRGHSAQQEDETAINYARRWLALDPLHEPAQRWLMQLYAWTGQPATAARQYQECVRVLKAELDAPPETETTALYNRIRSKQIGTRPAKPSPALPTPPVQELAPATAPAAADELRMVTVLCAALTEPLAATPTYPSAQTVQRMKRIFQVAEEILLRYDGRVERILSEGVVAIFGSHQLHEDDPERAVRAALELRQAAQSAGLQMSAGISSGHVYLSGQGAGLTTIGPVVNLALRLQNKADSDQLLVSEAIYRQTRGVAVYTPLLLALQSRAAPLQVYQIERLQPHPQKVRGIAGLHAPLVGRNKELVALQEALTAVQSGEGQLVTLIGDAGVGKSRLVSELKFGMRNAEFGMIANENSALRTPGRPLGPALLWLEGRCLEMSMSASYWPFLDILRTYLEWQPEEVEASRAGRIVAALDELVTRGTLTAEQREEMGPLLGNLLTVRFGNDWDERLKFAGPEQIRHQTLVTLRDFFVALTKQQPVVLVLEDLHWADSLSLDLITLLMEVLAQHPLLLLCVYRPEQQHRCWQLATLATAKCPDSFTEVRLRELTPQQSRTLVEALLTIENLAPKVKTTILEKAQGNPLFVEEVIRSLIDAGIVYRQGEVWQAKEEIENVVVPETVQSVILSRVDRLGEALKGLLQRAAVIGRVFGRRLLEQLAPPGLDLDNAVLALTHHALIYQERVVPEEEYSFKHVLVQEAIYQNTLSERRERFHRQVGEAMEQLYANNLAERYEQLAYHYDRSGMVEKAIEYLLKAGEKARRTYLNDEAIDYFQQALEHLERQSQALGERDKDWHLEVLRGLGRTYHGIGKMSEAETCFQQAIALGRVMGQTPHELVRLYYWLADILWWQNRFDEKIRLGEEGLALLGDDQQCVEAALMNTNIGYAYYVKGDYEQASIYIRRNSAFIAHLAYTEELRAAYMQLIMMYADVDKNVTAAMWWAQVLEEKAQRSHDLRALAGMHEVVAGSIFSEIGNLHGAFTDFEKSLNLLTKIGDITNAGDTMVSFITCVFLPVGDLQKAEAHAQGALPVVQKIGNMYYAALLYWVTGVISLCWGLPSRATDAFQKARQHWHDLGSFWEVRALLGLGRVYLLLKDHAEAGQWFQKAIALTNPADYPDWQHALVHELSGLEEVHDTAAFHAFCYRLQEERADLKAGVSSLTWSVKRTANRFVQWFLEPTQPDFRFAILDGSTTSFGLLGEDFQNLTSKIQNGEWVWYDQFTDCTFRADDALEILAANRRDLYHLNLSAPRLLRPTSGNFAMQTVCLPISDAQPTQGGILLWKDKENYLRLERGSFGKHEITFLGCLDNNDVIIGRGRLPAARLFLRLERIGGWVNALCSADGEQWFTVGHVDFPVADPLQVGMHAIGNIDRLIYPGAYPDGTAIRFESFALYRPSSA